MLNKFASQIEEIAHLSLGPDATLEQVNQDLLAIAERMRESQLTPVAADLAIQPAEQRALKTSYPNGETHRVTRQAAKPYR